MAANELIRQSLAGVTSMAAKSDILTPWKEQDRRRREVYTSEGVPDASIRRGLYGRSANSARPDLNSRDGIARSYRGGAVALQRFVDGHQPVAGDES
jgi:hypothetical protein